MAHGGFLPPEGKNIETKLHIKRAEARQEACAAAAPSPCRAMSLYGSNIGRSGDFILLLTKYSYRNIVESSPLVTGVFRRRSIDGAGEWRSAAAARNRSPGRHGNRSPDTTTRLRGASLHAFRRRMPEPETRTRMPKNRHGGAPRGARPRSQGDARRLASASACRVMCTPGVPRVSAFTRVLTRYAPRAVSALYSPSLGGTRTRIGGARARMVSGRRSVGCLTS